MIQKNIGIHKDFYIFIILNRNRKKTKKKNILKVKYINGQIAVGLFRILIKNNLIIQFLSLYYIIYCYNKNSTKRKQFFQVEAL